MLVLLLVVVWTGVVLLFMLKRLLLGTPSKDSGDRTDVWYVITTLLLQVINDFRHFLALVIFFLFGLIALIVVVSGIVNKDVTDGLQAVMAAFGGLLGSVIGYYFGEAKGRAETGQENRVEENVELEQELIPPIKPAGLDDVIASSAESEAT